MSDIVHLYSLDNIIDYLDNKIWTELMVINLDQLFTFSVYRVIALRDFLSFISKTVNNLTKSSELVHTFPNTAVFKEFKRLLDEYIRANADTIGEINLPEVNRVCEVLSSKINSLQYRNLLEHDIPSINASIEYLDNLINSPSMVPKADLLRINSEVQSTRVFSHFRALSSVKNNFTTICHILDLLGSKDDDLIDVKLLELFIDKFSLANGTIVLPGYISDIATSTTSVESGETGEGSIEPMHSERLHPSDYIEGDQTVLACHRVRSRVFEVANSLTPTEGYAIYNNVQIFYSLYSGIKSIAMLPAILNADEFLTFQAKISSFLAEFENKLTVSECDDEFRGSIIKLLNKLRSIPNHPKLNINGLFSVSKANAQLSIFNQLWFKLSDINTVTPTQRTFSYIKEECHNRVNKIITSSATSEALLTVLRFVVEKISTIDSAEDRDSFLSLREATIRELQEYVDYYPELGDSKGKILMLLDYIDDLEIWGLNFDAQIESIDEMLETHKAVYRTVIEELNSMIVSLQDAAESRLLDKIFLQKYYRACIVGCDQSEPARAINTMISEALNEVEAISDISVDKSIVMFKSSAHLVEEDIFRKRMEAAELRDPDPCTHTSPKFALVHDALEDLDTESSDVIIEFWSTTIYSDPMYDEVSSAFEKILNSEQLCDFIDTFLKGEKFRYNNILTQLMSYDSIRKISATLDIISKAMNHEDLGDDVIHELLDYGSPGAIDVVLHFLPEPSPAVNYRSPYPEHHNLTPMLRVVSSRCFNKDDASTIAEILANNGASLSDADAIGNNALLLAAKRENMMIFHTLLEYADSSVIEQKNQREESVASLREQAITPLVSLYSSRTRARANMFAVLIDNNEEEDNALQISSQIVSPAGA